MVKDISGGVATFKAGMPEGATIDVRSNTRKRKRSNRSGPMEKGRWLG